jgi:hypothetical protein
MSIDPPSPWLQWLALIVVLALAGCARPRRVECDVELVPINEPAAIGEFELENLGEDPTAGSENQP